MSPSFRTRRQGLALLGGCVAILLSLFLLLIQSPSSSRRKDLTVEEANAALVAASARYSTASKRHQRIQNLADDAGLSDTVLVETVSDASGKLRDMEFVRKLQATVDLNYARMVEAATESAGQFSEEIAAREAWAKVSLSGVEGTYVGRSDVFAAGVRRRVFDLMVVPEDMKKSKEALQNTAVARIELRRDAELFAKVINALDSAGFEYRRVSLRIRPPNQPASHSVFVRESQRADAVQLLRNQIGRQFVRNLVVSE